MKNPFATQDRRYGIRVSLILIQAKNSILMKKILATIVVLGLAFYTSQAQTTAKEWFDKGVSLKKSEKYKDAIEAFKKAAALDASYSAAWHQLGWCYNEEGMYTEAIDALKKEEKAGPADKASNFFELGYSYKSLKKYDEALANLNQAIAIDDEYALAFKERGNTYYKMKEYEKALDDFNKYENLSEEIDDAVFFYNKGWTENDLEKYEEAVKSLKYCVDLDRSYSDGYAELGYAYYKLNQNSEAINNYRRAMELDKESDHIPILGIADVYFDNIKNYDSALVYYEKGIKLKKDSRSAFYRLGWCYNDKKRYQDALEPLKQAIHLDAEYKDAKTELGYAYYKLEKYDDALEQFNPIMNKDSKHQLSRYYAGFCYYMKGEQERLKKMIDELTALNSTKYVETLQKYVK